jgi:lysine 2,3-aminomutase
MQELVDAGGGGGPIARQFVPDTRELVADEHDLDDPIGDNTHSPVPGIVHRYPDRVLLTPTRVCPVYCRFCFRREVVGPGADAVMTAAELHTALAYIKEHDGIWEVILSGGDPLILSPRRLGSILGQLRAIEHVRVIRLHTRVPLVAPERIDDDMLAVLRRAAPLFLVLHANHEDEFTAAGEQACGQLVDRGVPMLGQTVLLRGVNDDANALEALLRRMVENRIKPYYLHHADRANGTRHFRTTIDDGRSLVASLRGRVSGICQPNYVLDIPGGHGKSPIGPNYVSSTGNGRMAVMDYQGNWHEYES